MASRPFPLTQNQTALKRRVVQRRERGIASIEAAIMLPLLIIVFAGVLYVEKLVSGAQRATSTARSCAWRVAASGCGEVPPECPDDAGEGEPKTQSRLDQAGVPSSIDLAGIAREEGAEDDDRTNNVLSEIGSRLNDLLLDRYEAHVEEEFQKSKILGGEKVTIDKSFSLPCNSKPSSAEGVADALFENFSPPEKSPEPERIKDPHDPDS